VLSVNPAAERILGLTLDQLTGRTSVDPRWQAIHEDGTAFPGDQHPAMVALRTGQPVTGVVMGVFNPQRGEQRWLRISAIPLFRPGETQPYQVFATFNDFTERFAAMCMLEERP
jgi:PAS domain S-box-containing protein